MIKIIIIKLTWFIIELSVVIFIAKKTKNKIKEIFRSLPSWKFKTLTKKGNNKKIIKNKLE